MPAAVRTAFEVAFWFADKALNDNEYLQPQKLQRLMFLAQASYAALHPGQTLMPAVFVADELGPVEPNVHLAFSKGRPDVDIDPVLPEAVIDLLDYVWRRFGHLSAERLARMTKDMPAYQEAVRRGVRSEIDPAAMQRSMSQPRALAGGDRNGAPIILRTQTGKPVRVTTWTPGAKPASGI